MHICTADKQIINTLVKVAALRSNYEELSTCHIQSALPTHRFTLLGSAFLCTIIVYNCNFINQFVLFFISTPGCSVNALYV